MPSNEPSGVRSFARVGLLGHIKLFSRIVPCFMMTEQLSDSEVGMVIGWGRLSTAAITTAIMLSKP